MIKKTMDKAVIIYDGACPVCSGAVKWIGENEIENSFEMLTCQSNNLAKDFPHLHRSECMKAMQLVLPNGTIIAGEQALPEILKRLRRYRFAALLFKLPGAGRASRIVYRWFADRRYRIASLMSHITKNRSHSRTTRKVRTCARSGRCAGAKQ